tara:strand:+ start:327 stop:593 length:267 start_codon:yes stop_codon:yes gene_type:complete
MKYALIKNNIIEQISYQKVDGWEEVDDNIFTGMIKKDDGTFDDTDEVKAQKQQAILNEEKRIERKASAKQKLEDLGFTVDEIKEVFNL